MDDNPNLANFWFLRVSINVHKVALYKAISTLEENFIMRKFDSRHLVFHVLVALYFIWTVVFAVLIGMSLYNAYGLRDVKLAPLFQEWIFTNLIMGTALFIVIRLFRNRTLLDKVILYSYGFMALISLVVVFILI